MVKKKNESPTTGTSGTDGPYTVYCAGGLFTQDELATNVSLKESIWRLSRGRFQLFLPQSRELQEIHRTDVESFLRNIDLLEIIKADLVLARFEGLEVDAGTVVEFAIAKSLGKPTVTLRCDFRRHTATGYGEPYNLMAKNWPRNVSINLNATWLWSEALTAERQAAGDLSQAQTLMSVEKATSQKTLEEIARQAIAGMETVIKMKSSIPPDLQEAVYHSLRFSAGSDFEHMLTEGELKGIIDRLRKKGTL